MQGRRRPDGTPVEQLEPGDYVFDSRPHFAGKWAIRAPDGTWGGYLGPGHHVEVHDDGTITVTPSILVFKPRGVQGWHGFLERGTWREC
jgi:hypothetical protein